MKRHTDSILSAKFDNVISTFFLDNPDQKFLLFQHLLACIHSYSSPHFIWTCPWLDLKTFFVKLHTDTLLSAKFDNDMSTFFVDNTDQYLLLFSETTRTQTLLFLPSFHLNKFLTSMKKIKNWIFAKLSWIIPAKFSIKLKYDIRLTLAVSKQNENTFEAK